MSYQNSEAIIEGPPSIENIQEIDIEQAIENAKTLNVGNSYEEYYMNTQLRNHILTPVMEDPSNEDYSSKDASFSKSEMKAIQILNITVPKTVKKQVSSKIFDVFNNEINVKPKVDDSQLNITFPPKTNTSRCHNESIVNKLTCQSTFNNEQTIDIKEKSIETTKNFQNNILPIIENKHNTECVRPECRCIVF